MLHSKMIKFTRSDVCNFLHASDLHNQSTIRILARIRDCFSKSDTNYIWMIKSNKPDLIAPYFFPAKLDTNLNVL